MNAVGVDVGGTKIAAGLISFPDGRILTRRMKATLPARGGKAVLDDVLQTARELKDEGETLGHPVSAIGLGLCEIINRAGQIVSANCIHWITEPVREKMSEIAPAFIEADVRAAAIAESLFGAGKSFGDFLYVTVGTGISCCLMIAGKPYLGARGATGTMGSSPLSLPCRECGHVNERTLEQIASGPALVASFNAQGRSADGGREVIEAAQSGDRVATGVIELASRALASQVGLLVNVVDPEGVVVGGGLGASEGLFWEEFAEAIREHIWWDAHRDIPVVRAATGADAGWIGAAAKAWQEWK